MNKIKWLAFVLAASTLVVLGQVNSVAGTWKVSGDVVGNPLEQVCTFAVDGKKLTGSCKSGEDKPAEVTGEVNDKKVSWKYNGEYNGEKLTISFDGMLDGADLKGTIDVQPFSVGGTFTAKKDAAK